MKKSKIALALCTCLPFAATAVSVAPNGRGQVLLYPYYTVEAGHTTTLSVSNHGNRGKALAVNFREALNGRTVMNFHVYLAAHDTWTAALFSQSAEQPAALVTDDASCTVPGIRSSIAVSLPQLPDGRRYVPFRNFGYSGASADGGPQLLSRTRSGFVEIIEMGTLVEGSTSAMATAPAPAGGCAVLETAWAPNGYWQRDPHTDLGPPEGGLSGSAQLVDVADGSLAAYRATALQDFSSIVQHPRPGSEVLTLGSAVSDAGSGTVTSTVLTERGARTSTWPRERAFEAVSAALAQASLGNEYLVDSGLGAASEWVLSFPTRHLHTDPARVPAAVAPFTQRFTGTSFVPPATCETVPVSIYDRSGRRTSLVALTGQNPGQVNLCGAVQVLDFNAGGSGASALLGAPAARLVPDDYPAGLAELDFSEFLGAPASGGERWRGLPVIGFGLWRYQNGGARPGQLGLYSGSVPHTGTTACSGCTP